MHRLAHSPSKSPARKRQRLSSPTYDDQVEELSPEDLEAFDEIEAKLSKTQRYPSSSAIKDSNSKPQLRNDPDNPFATDTPPTAYSGFSSASRFTGFASASSFRLDTAASGNDHERSPSPDHPPPEPDYDAWFAPATDLPLVVGFQTANSVAAAFAPAQIGFSKASTGVFLQPSTTALAKAKEKMDAIWAEEPQNHPPTVTESQSGVENLFRTAAAIPRLASPERPALRALDNSFNSPGTPSPAEFSRPSSGLPAFSSPTSGPLKAKAFKPPTFVSSPLNPKPNTTPLSTRPRFASSGSISANTQHPLANVVSVAPETPVRPSTTFATPLRPTLGSSRLSKVKAPFRTPFKPGMRPGEPGRALLEQPRPVQVKPVTPAKQPSLGPVLMSGPRSSRQFFDLTPPVGRKTLSSSSLAPGGYSDAELENLGIAVSELKQITPSLALYYSFHIPESENTPAGPSTPAKLLGPAAALEELNARGCSLATKAWVDNHWSLILWKLAGMVCLEPERESDPAAMRWCWGEVMRQLLYRYERELNGGVRPPLRCIATQDAPASCPMVLCVSNITWSDSGMADDGIPIPSHPELEVTDGWYRLRAQVDAPIARAVRRGVIRIGRKIGVIGARLSNERKDPQEVLEAYNTSKLVISGNSSHLVPWHTKLGFQISPWVSTMHSLTADGGVVATMDLVLLKVYPVAFLEFIEDKNGEKRREGPRNQRDEDVEDEKWKRRRAIHESKLREELTKKETRYQSYAERLERKAGARFVPAADDELPDEIEELYDQLEDPNGAAGVISRASANTAGWLARFITDRMEKERERAGEEIEQELKTLCPPREVRNFRVLFVQDACTRRRAAHRTAQLTVWDALALPTMVERQRYAVTNVVPTSQSAWMDCGAGSEIYLSTRRDSKWKRL